MIKSYEQFYWHIAQLHTTCSRRQPDLVQKVEKSKNNLNPFLYENILKRLFFIHQSRNIKCINIFQVDISTSPEKTF